jgi:integrase
MARRNKGLQISYRKDRECWEVIEYERGRRRRRATDLRSREEAQERLVELLSVRPPKEADGQTVGAAMAYYLTHHAPTVARPDNLEWVAEKIAPFWGNVKISEINKALCQSYAAWRRKPFDEKHKKTGRKMSTGTIRKELEQVQAAVNFARENGLITLAPVFWKPDPPPSKSRWLTGREAARLLRAARGMKQACDYLPLFILLGLYTAARKEAILQLRWHQVDFKRGLIDYRPGQKSAIKGRAVVPIPPRLMRELIRAKQRGSDIGHVIEHNGKPLKNIKMGFAVAIERAGLPGVTPHTLRHTAISWQVQKGTPLAKVAKWAGHSTSVMIERVYGHLQPEHLDEIAASYGGKTILTAQDTAPKRKKISDKQLI